MQDLATSNDNETKQKDIKVTQKGDKIDKDDHRKGRGNHNNRR